MRVTIKTKKIDFNFDDPNLKCYAHFDSENKRVLEFLKELIQKVSDESIKQNKIQ
jgi:hypothetical protein